MRSSLFLMMASDTDVFPLFEDGQSTELTSPRQVSSFVAVASMEEQVSILEVMSSLFNEMPALFVAMPALLEVRSSALVLIPAVFAAMPSTTPTFPAAEDGQSDDDKSLMQIPCL